MTLAITEMIDAVYDVSGDTLPSHYAFPLWHELVRHVPTLASDPSIGVIPFKTAPSEAGLLLAKRAKLTIRLPASLASHASALNGKQLNIDGVSLQLGASKLKSIQSFTTLHSNLVASNDESEEQFLANVTKKLTELGAVGDLLCGLHGTMSTRDRTIRGFSLVIHNMKAEPSLRLQYLGLGADRQFGCGIFVPYKTITDLRDE
ncbi:MAG: type I-MYXAN CRISPR-associated protein Cas6/Cmx6 [Gallionellaceae bacterium]